MKSKISVFRWILFGLGIMMLLTYFIWPFMTIDKRTMISTGDALGIFSDDPDWSDEDPTKDFIEMMPSFWSGVSYSAFCVEANRFLEEVSAREDQKIDLALLLDELNLGFAQLEWETDGKLVRFRDYRLMIAMMLLPCILGIALAIVCILTKRPGYIVGIVTGGITFIIFLFFSIRVFHFSSAKQTVLSLFNLANPTRGDDTNVIMSRWLPLVHFHTAYILVLVLPIAVLTLSILGLILDKKEIRPEPVPDPAPWPVDPPLPTPPIIDDSSRAILSIDEERQPDHYITGIQGSVLGQRFAVTEQGVLIGRNPLDCRIVINDSRVSKVHCQVGYSRQYHAYFVRDVSSNGTFRKNKERLPRNQIIAFHEGDTIYLPSGDGFRFDQIP